MRMTDSHQHWSEWCWKMSLASHTSGVKYLMMRNQKLISPSGLPRPLLCFNDFDTIWTLTTISRVTEIHLYMSIIVLSATYASETWKRTVKIAHQLDIFHQRYLWNILRITWRDRVINEEVLWRSGQRQISDTVTNRRLQWAGHVLHLPA